MIPQPLIVKIKQIYEFQLQKQTVILDHRQIPMHCLLSRTIRTIDAYMLGCVDLPSMQVLQQQFASTVVSHQQHRAIAVICEHPICRSDGTEATPADESLFGAINPLNPNCDRMSTFSYRRAGGRWQHGPGQFHLYLTLNLNLSDQSLCSWRGQIEHLLLDMTDRLHLSRIQVVHGVGLLGHTGHIARSTLSVRNNVLQTAIAINLSRTYQFEDTFPASSIAAESMKQIQPATLKTSLVESLSASLPEASMNLLTTHPALSRYREYELQQLRKEMHTCPAQHE